MSEDGFYDPEGNGTEVAMLKFLQLNEIEVHKTLTDRQRDCDNLLNLAFSPIQKRQTTAVRDKVTPDTVRIIVKGAPEYVTDLCTKILVESGNEPPID